jgi:hypothetical protein
VTPACMVAELEAGGCFVHGARLVCRFEPVVS